MTTPDRTADVALVSLPLAARPYRFTHTPNISLASLAGVLHQHRIPVRVLDAHAHHTTEDHLLRRLLELRPSLVGLNVPSIQAFQVGSFARRLRRGLPGVKVVVGGPHVTALPVETLLELPDVDYVAVGEGEQTLLELASGRDPAAILGLASRDDAGQPRPALPRPPLEDLSLLPRPAWECFEPLSGQAIGAGEANVPVSTSRGCPYRCDFCPRIQGHRVRQRPLELVLDEVRHIVEELGAPRVTFTDEVFTIDRERSLALCGELHRRGLSRRMRWSCTTRVDRVDAEVLAALRRGGCDEIFFGVESGNAEVLRRVHKGFSLDQAREAVALARRAKLHVQCAFIIGHPFETRRTILDTIAFASEVDPDFATFSILKVFPGTRVWEMAERGEGGLRWRTRDWQTFGRLMGHVTELEAVPLPELLLLQLYGFASFYLRPRRMRRFIAYYKLRELMRYSMAMLSSLART
jgi:anaerobic magnesium-protoporphyrin IX monomethyl ester cyclase